MITFLDLFRPSSSSQWQLALGHSFISIEPQYVDQVHPGNHVHVVHPCISHFVSGTKYGVLIKRVHLVSSVHSMQEGGRGVIVYVCCVAWS